MNYENGIKLLTDSAGRALGSFVNKLKIYKDLGYGDLKKEVFQMQYKTELYVVFWVFICFLFGCSG